MGSKWADLKFVLTVFAVVALAVAVHRWSNYQPPQPQHEQAERVDDDSGLGSRSSEWPRVRAEFVRHNPTCAACGSARELNVHHVKPYWSHPQLELEHANLITLCREHHWKLGHDPDGPNGPQKPDWKKSNANVRRDAARMLEGKL